LLIKKGVGEVTLFTHKQEMHAWVLKMNSGVPKKQTKLGMAGFGVIG